MPVATRASGKTFETGKIRNHELCCLSQLRIMNIEIGESSRMKTIQTQIDVPGTGTLTVPVPADIAPGKHSVLVVIDESPMPQVSALTLDDFPVDVVGQWPSELSLRREDIYSDDGR